MQYIGGESCLMAPILGGLSWEQRWQLLFGCKRMTAGYVEAGSMIGSFGSI